jgi:hypothetical protein
MNARLATPAECFAAGWEDGADDEPLTREEIERLVVLHRPYLQAEAKAS